MGSVWAVIDFVAEVLNPQWLSVGYGIARTEVAQQVSRWLARYRRRIMTEL
jgi:hypothetical protein